MKLTTAFSLLSVLLLLLLVAPFPARAQQRGLFLVKNPLQYIDFTYEYRNLTTSSNNHDSSYETHNLKAKYYLGFDYAIYDPDILVGTFGGSLNYEKSYYSNSPGPSGSSSIQILQPGFEYNLTGTFLTRKPVTVDFIARKQVDQAQPYFSPAYDIYNDYYGADIKYKNPILPSIATYSYTTTRTSGLGNDTTTKSELATLQSVHTYRSLSTSQLYLTYNDMETSQSYLNYTTSHTLLSLDLSNSLAFKINRSSTTLGSNLSLQKDYGDYSGSSLQWREQFTCYLGRALQTGLNYSYYRINRTPDSQTTNNFEAWIEHQLYNSLRTRLSLRGNYDSYSYGTINTTGGGIAISYWKNLPDAGKLAVGISDFYDVKDQNLNSSFMTQNDEPIIISLIPGSYPLKNSDVLTISDVYNQTHSRRYFPVVDYDSQTVGATTYLTIVPGGAIQPGDVILVTYTYRANKQVTYGTNTFNVNANLSLLQGRYLLYASYQRSDQNLIDGSANLVSLGPSSFLRGGAEYRYISNTFGAEYQNIQYINDSREAVTGYWRYVGNIGLVRIDTELRDTYTWYSSAATTTPQGNFTDNTLSAMVNLTRQVFRNGVLQLSANYLMIRGDNPSQDNVVFRLRYLWSLGKFKLLLDYQLFYKDIAFSSQMNNYVKFEIRRYF